MQCYKMVIYNNEYMDWEEEVERRVFKQVLY
jgi:hypothetical protein